MQDKYKKMSRLELTAAKRALVIHLAKTDKKLNGQDIQNEVKKEFDESLDLGVLYSLIKRVRAGQEVDSAEQVPSNRHKHESKPKLTKAPKQANVATLMENLTPEIQKIIPGLLKGMKITGADSLIFTVKDENTLSYRIHRPEFTGGGDIKI